MAGIVSGLDTNIIQTSQTLKNKKCQVDMLTVLALQYSGKGNTRVNQPGLMVSSSSMTDTVLKIKVHGT